MQDLDPLIAAAHRALNGDLNRAFSLNSCLTLLRSLDARAGVFATEGRS